MAKFQRGRSIENDIPRLMPFGEFRGIEFGEIPILSLYALLDDAGVYGPVRVAVEHAIDNHSQKKGWPSQNKPSTSTGVIKVKCDDNRPNNRRLRPPGKWMTGPLGVGVPFAFPFGKHKGKPLSSIPDSYLEWVLSLNDIAAALRILIKQHLSNPSA